MSRLVHMTIDICVSKVYITSALMSSKLVQSTSENDIAFKEQLICIYQLLDALFCKRKKIGLVE